jgi:hypothetical protein
MLKLLTHDNIVYFRAEVLMLHLFYTAEGTIHSLTILDYRGRIARSVVEWGYRYGHLYCILGMF